MELSILISVLPERARKAFKVGLQAAWRGVPRFVHEVSVHGLVREAFRSAIAVVLLHNACRDQHQLIKPMKHMADKLEHAAIN
jgi:hypothetical protein